MKIVIIGGGTAGWLAGLYFNKKGYSDITVIDSSRVGILGAGEASTPNFPSILSYVGIDTKDFLKTTGATIKVANDFINWSPFGGKYSHSFVHPDMSENKSKHIHGYHFDARKCAGYFKNIAEERGINHLDVNITHFTQNETGDITLIHTEENIDIPTEFVIDCSGFARLCIGKLYKGKWKSYSNYLKANAAIAYFLPQENENIQETRTHTQSISMKNGWMWQAPLQHRWGCGYVFNDTYITNDEAKKEVEDYLGREIEIVKSFKFDAGAYEETWINNCIALGLSGGFLEPLEGTSLMTVIHSLFKIGTIKIENQSFDNRKIYNTYVNDMNYESMLFVRHHYNCGRIDTKFWRDINEEKLPTDLINILNDLYSIKDDKELLLTLKSEQSTPTFGIYNYQIVDLGHRVKTSKTFI